MNDQVLRTQTDRRQLQQIIAGLTEGVILIEPDLPGLDGLAFLTAIEADPRTRGQPVVALSTDPDPALARRGRARGFAGWLTKPLEIGLFTRTLRRLLDAEAADPHARWAGLRRRRP